MNTPALRIARLEAELADRCLELANSRKRVRELEQAIKMHRVRADKLSFYPRIKIEEDLYGALTHSEAHL